MVNGILQASKTKINMTKLSPVFDRGLWRLANTLRSLTGMVTKCKARLGFVLPRNYLVDLFSRFIPCVQILPCPIDVTPSISHLEIMLVLLCHRYRKHTI